MLYSRVAKDLLRARFSETFLPHIHEIQMRIEGSFFEWIKPDL